MFVLQETLCAATVYQSAGITDSTGSVLLKHATVALMQSTMLAHGDSTHWADPDPWSPWSVASLMKITLDQLLELLGSHRVGGRCFPHVRHGGHQSAEPVVDIS